MSNRETEGRKVPLSMFMFSCAVDWQLMCVDSVMDNLWPRDASVEDSPDAGYEYHNIICDLSPKESDV